jgi:hypothetical protein
MASVAIVGKKGSKSCRAIRDNTSLRAFTRFTKQVDAIVNYGLAGKRLDTFLRTKPSARRIHMINRYAGRSKYSAIREVERNDVRVPESRVSLPLRAKKSDWIEKRVRSSQGNGIRQARGRREIPGKYYQKMIKERPFELRVHAFRWIDSHDWYIFKRVGPSDQIAWNFHQGGHFITVRYPNDYEVFREAKRFSERVLVALNMSFGAVDFVVDKDRNVYFIEINSSPGISPLTEHIYFSTFEELTKLSKRRLSSLR